MEHNDERTIYVLKWKIIRYSNGSYIFSTHDTITNPKALVVIVDTEDEEEAIKKANRKYKDHENHVSGIKNHQRFFDDLLDEESPRWKRILHKLGLWHAKK